MNACTSNYSDSFCNSGTGWYPDHRWYPTDIFGKAGSWGANVTAWENLQGIEGPIEVDTLGKIEGLDREFLFIRKEAGTSNRR